MTDASSHHFPLVPFLAQDAPAPTGAPGFQGRNSAPASTGAEGGSAPLGPSGGGNGAQQQQQSPGFLGGGGFMLILLGFMAFMIVSSIFAGRKQKRMRNEMLSALGKHDRVMTNGGMIGTIVEVKDAELVLRIDDETGARAHFAREAVASVIKSSGAAT